MLSGPETRLSGRFGNLRHGITENGVARGEGDGPLDLNLENRRVAPRVLRVHDDIVERMTFSRALKLCARNRGAGQASRLGTDEHGQQVVRADLALEVAAGGAACCRAGGVGSQSSDTLRVARFCHLFQRAPDRSIGLLCRGSLRRYHDIIISHWEPAWLRSSFETWKTT